MLRRDYSQHESLDKSAAPSVLVQREVETVRSLLASITPFSANRLGTTSPNAVVTERAAAETGFKKRTTRWVARAHTARLREEQTG